MQMNIAKKILICAAFGLVLASCGSSPNQAVPNTATISSNVLQLSVGTANLYGLQTALNVVTTYRQPSGGYNAGASGTLVNSPTLTLPHTIPAGLSAGAFYTGYDFTSTAPSAPAPGETFSITSTSQAPIVVCSPASSSFSFTSFGQSGGVFGLGIEPYNAQAQGDCPAPPNSLTGSPFQVAPYPVPLYDDASPTYVGPFPDYDPNAFVPWGGPPAFLNGGQTNSVVGSSNYPTGTAGVSEGIDVFAGIAPVASGAYTLTVAVPATTSAGTTTTTQTASFSLPAALTVLPVPAAPAYVPDGAGGGTFAFVMPAGATEAYLELTDYGPNSAGAVSCNGSGTGNTDSFVGNGIGNAVYYTIETTASGTLTLPDTIGPGVHATPSVCTAAQNTTANGFATPADQLAIQVIAFDYDLYHASYPASLGNPAPTITGAHSSDLAISAATCQIGAVPGSCTALLSSPLFRSRAPGAAALSLRR